MPQVTYSNEITTPNLRCRGKEPYLNLDGLIVASRFNSGTATIGEKMSKRKSYFCRDTRKLGKRGGETEEMIELGA